MLFSIESRFLELIFSESFIYILDCGARGFARKATIRIGREENSLGDEEGDF